MARSLTRNGRPVSQSRKDRGGVKPAPRPLSWYFPPAVVGAIVIVAMTSLAYIPAFRAGYIWDDSDHVTQVPLQRTLSGLKWVWFKIGMTPQYYPLTHTTFWLEYRLWGRDPAGYHAVNILLHAINSILVWRLLRRLKMPGAWLAGAIFALHPVCVESVAWITERKNTLSGLFYLLAMLAAVRAWRVGEPPADLRLEDEPPRSSFAIAYAMCLLCFIAAVLSKTVTCTLPAAMVLLLWWKHGRVTRRDWLTLAPMFAIAIGVARLTSGMEESNVGAKGPDFAFTVADRVLIAGRAIWFYAGKLVWPHPLAFIYRRWEIDPHAAWQWIFPIAAGVVVSTLFFLRSRIGRGPVVAALFFIGTLFPALGFVNVYPMRFSFLADHFQYLASLSMIAGAVTLLARIPLGAGMRVVASGGLLVLLGILTFSQARIYHDEQTLWKDTLAKNPDCWLAMDNLAGEAAATGNLNEAADWDLRALKVHPAQMEAHLQLGEVRMKQQNWDAAAREFTAAAAIRPDRLEADHAMAGMLVARGDLAGAMALYQKILSREPRLESARLEYVKLLDSLHRFPEEEQQYLDALEAYPDSVPARSGLAGLRIRAGDYPAALRWASEAAAIDPLDANVCNTLGFVLMQIGHPAEAADWFQTAIDDNPNFAEAYDGLGNAMAAQGHPLEAADLFRQAITLKPTLTAARQHLAQLQGGR